MIKGKTEIYFAFIFINFCEISCSYERGDNRQFDDIQLIPHHFYFIIIYSPTIPKKAC